MRVLDLFAGIGGFSLAAHWMGWETVAFVEKEPFCQKVLRKNFGQDIDIHDDIFDFSGEPFRGSVDLITGGFPCQPFSAAGKRKGRSDERHLFPEMLRVIREVKPRWVVAENVRGLLSIESGRVFAEVIASLESEGFEVVTFCVPASAVEAPHRRDRLWIIANDNGKRLEGQTERTTRSSIQQHCERSTDDYSDATNASNTRLQGNERGADAAGYAGLCSRVRANERRGVWTEHWTEAAARFCRVDDGVSDRVHRLKALGNSIVPQIAYEIFKAINDTQKEGQ